MISHIVITYCCIILVWFVIVTYLNIKYVNPINKSDKPSIYFQYLVYCLSALISGGIILIFATKFIIENIKIIRKRRFNINDVVYLYPRILQVKVLSYIVSPDNNKILYNVLVIDDNRKMYVYEDRIAHIKMDINKDNYENIINKYYTRQKAIKDFLKE